MKALSAALTFLLASSCQTFADTPRAPRIGAILPFSGIQSKQGELAKAGIELALIEFPAFSPILTFEDSRSDTTQAVSAFNKLRNLDDADVILTMGSPAAMALLPLANRERTPLLAMAVASGFSRPEDFGFRLMGTAAGFGERIDALLKSRKLARTALLYVSDDYGAAYQRYFFAERKSGEPPSAAESYLPGTTDFRPALLRLKARKPDAVILASWALEAGTIVRQAKDIGFPPAVFVCPSACDNPDIVTTSAGAGESLVVVASASGTTETRTKTLLTRFREKPTSVVLRFYDAIALVRSAAGSCSGSGAEYRTCLRNQISKAKDIPGASYRIAVDENGDIQDAYDLKRIQGQELVLDEENTGGRRT